MREKLRIIQITSFYPPHLGGMENCVKEISTRLAQEGHRVEVFTSDIGCQTGKLSSIENLKIHYLRSFQFAHTPIMLSLFFKLLTIPKKSIIHLHIAQSFTPEIVWLISKIRNIRYIAHVRTDTVPSGKLGFLLPLYKKYILKNILKSATKVIVLNEDYKNLVEKRYSIPSKKIVVIPNATDFSISQDKLKPISKPAKLLYVGRLSPEKNISSILRAMKTLLDSDICVKLVLAGDGPEWQNISNLSKELGIKKAVIFKGRIAREKLQRVYENSDMVILPSFMEAFSSVLLEAMASRSVIIASDIPGTRNIIKHKYNGLLVNPHSVNDLVNAIKLIIDKPLLREKLVKNGSQEIKKYSWDRIVEQTQSLYQEVNK